MSVNAKDDAADAADDDDVSKSVAFRFPIKAALPPICDIITPFCVSVKRSNALACSSVTF